MCSHLCFLVCACLCVCSQIMGGEESPCHNNRWASLFGDSAANFLPPASLLGVIFSPLGGWWVRRGGSGMKRHTENTCNALKLKFILPVSLYNLIQIPQSVAHSYLNEHLTKSLLCFRFSRSAFGRLPCSVALHLPGRFSANWPIRVYRTKRVGIEATQI